MNYILRSDRSQIRIEAIEDYVEQDSEVRVIDKVVDAMDIETLRLKIGDNEFIGRPMFSPKDILKLYI